MKPLIDLEKLNTKRLLSFFKKERKRFYDFTSGCTCECCGDFYWDIKSDKNNDLKKEKYEIWKKYISDIKDILSKREHIYKINTY